jgi:hypothetical protein
MHICYVVLLMLVPSCMSWPFVKIILKICSVYFSHIMLEFWIILFCYYVWNNDDFFLFWSFMVGVKEEWTIIHWKTSCLSTWWVIIVALCFFFFFCIDLPWYAWIYLSYEHLAGITVGHKFFSRDDMVATGFRGHWLNGIDYIRKLCGKLVCIYISFYLDCKKYIFLFPLWYSFNFHSSGLLDSFFLC